MPAIRARGWGWRHPGRRAWAVRGLDLDIEDGERVLLLGASGAGKSTLLTGLAGLLDAGPDGNGEEEGALLVDGVPARRARDAAVARGAGEAATGLLLQDPEAQTVLARCGDDVAFGLENHAVPPHEIWPRVDAALRDVRLDVGRDRPTSRLSGGQRQRLALAGVLALQPHVLLLDEPTAMLDLDGGRALREVVAAQLAETGATCVVVEHRVAEWLEHLERVVVLEPGGGALADGPAERVLREHGDALAVQGVWVPDHEPRLRRHRPGPSGGPLLSTAGLALRRPGQASPVLRDVDLSVDAGRALALVGANGSGKSTLALALAGLARPAQGRVEAAPGLADGLTAEPHRWRARELVRRIGSVFQDPRHQLVAGTVAAELAVGPRRLGLPEAAVTARTDELLQRLRLTHLAEANPFTLSGGEQRRLSVATALATQPRLLVLDEPTFGQDARTWAELVDLFHEQVADGTGLVAATHDEAFVAALTDEAVHLRDGLVHVAPVTTPARAAG